MRDETRRPDDVELEVNDDDEIVIEDRTEEPDGAEPLEPEVEPAGDEAGDSEEVAKLREELVRYRELYLRKLAEFDNFRKRVEREMAELERTGIEGLVRELIPVLDNFERALQHTDDTSPEAFRQGVEMIAKQLWDVLVRRGLEVSDPGGERFQPEYHEAVLRAEGSEHEPGTVVDVLAKGYLLSGRLLRPAMVSVAVEPVGGPSKDEGGGRDPSGEGEAAS